MRGPWTLPNFITLVRLAALPFFLVSIAGGRFGIALAIFVAAGASDGVDGYLARRFDMKSALGAYLDPIADKLLLMTSYLFLAIPSYPALVKVPVWLAVMVLSRRSKSQASPRAGRPTDHASHTMAEAPGANTDGNPHPLRFSTLPSLVFESRTTRLDKVTLP